MVEVTLSVPNTKNGDHPEAMLKVFLTIIEKTPSGGATLDDLKDAYEDMKGARPCDRTIRRIIERINTALDPLACRSARDPEDVDGGEDDIEAQPWPIEVSRQSGVRRYIFTRGSVSIAPRLAPDLAFLMALSLYPQQRSVLPEQFKLMMTFVFENILRRLAEFASLRTEMERYVHISGYGPAGPRLRVRLVQDVLHALRARKRVRLRYLRAYDGSKVDRDVEPYGLLCRHNVWYLVGRCLASRERRVYRLDHIERMTVLEDKTYEIPRDFSLRDAYRSSWEYGRGARRMNGLSPRRSACGPRRASPIGSE